MSAIKFIERDIVSFYIPIEGIEYENIDFKLNSKGLFTLKPPYCWDGATPKFNFIGITWGSPDGKINMITGKPTYYYASMVHDIINKSDLPITYKQWNNVALYIMKKDSHYLWRIYNWVNCTFGRFYGRWRKKPK